MVKYQSASGIYPICKKSYAFKAGLSLEAILVIPMALVIVFAFIGVLQGQEDAIILSHALDQTAREVALLLPLADLAEHYVDPVSWIQEVIPDPDLAQIALNGLGDMAATVLASPLLLKRLDYWAKATARSRQRRQPAGARCLAVDFDPARQSIWLCLTFERPNYLKADSCQIKARVPVWNAHLFKQPGEEEDEEEDDDIWSLSNFERGLAFRRLFGGHLPQFYPVIASWDGHEAVSIKSMDWTAPTWSSPASVKRRLDGFIQDLASFEGAGGEGPSPGDIQGRRLILVIPCNDLDWKTGSLLDAWRQDAARQGVILDIREYGISRVHEPLD